MCKNYIKYGPLSKAMWFVPCETGCPISEVSTIYVTEDNINSLVASDRTRAAGASASIPQGGVGTNDTIGGTTVQAGSNTGLGGTFSTTRGVERIHNDLRNMSLGSNRYTNLGRPGAPKADISGGIFAQPTRFETGDNNVHYTSPRAGLWPTASVSTRSAQPAPRDGILEGSISSSHMLEKGKHLSQDAGFFSTGHVAEPIMEQETSQGIFGGIYAPTRRPEEGRDHIRNTNLGTTPFSTMPFATQAALPERRAGLFGRNIISREMPQKGLYNLRDLSQGAGPLITRGVATDTSQQTPIIRVFGEIIAPPVKPRGIIAPPVKPRGIIAPPVRPGIVQHNVRNVNLAIGLSSSADPATPGAQPGRPTGIFGRDVTPAHVPPGGRDNVPDMSGEKVFVVPTMQHGASQRMSEEIYTSPERLREGKISNPNTSVGTGPFSAVHVPMAVTEAGSTPSTLGGDFARPPWSQQAEISAKNISRREGLFSSVIEPRAGRQPEPKVGVFEEIFTSPVKPVGERDEVWNANSWVETCFHCGSPYYVRGSADLPIINYIEYPPSGDRLPAVAVIPWPKIWH
ncbi:hypothetical protein EV426DRAFT_577623 [Tirmania nivea]|nr:hypothetical protein EV426DRAFT_577623 [Tirmania nivea]